MNFDFSDDQKLLRDQARKFLQDKCDRSVVRSILEDASTNPFNFIIGASEKNNQQP